MSKFIPSARQFRRPAWRRADRSDIVEWRPWKHAKRIGTRLGRATSLLSLPESNMLDLARHLGRLYHSLEPRQGWHAGPAGGGARDADLGRRQRVGVPRGGDRAADGSGIGRGRASWTSQERRGSEAAPDAAAWQGRVASREPPTTIRRRQSGQSSERGSGSGARLGARYIVARSTISNSRTRRISPGRARGTPEIVQAPSGTGRKTSFLWRRA